MCDEDSLENCVRMGSALGGGGEPGGAGSYIYIYYIYIYIYVASWFLESGSEPRGWGFHNRSFGGAIWSYPQLSISTDRLYMGVSKNKGTPKWMIYKRKFIKMDDLGVPLFSDTST